MGGFASGFSRARTARCLVWTAGAVMLLFSPRVSAQSCVGDCNGDGEVAINELIIGVNIALGNNTVETCPEFDDNDDGEVAINELIIAVNNALTGCPAVEDTSTPTPSDTATWTPTDSPTETVAATYTMTQTALATSTTTEIPTITSTPTGTPTGTVAATYTVTQAATETPLTTWTPTGTPTGTVAATYTVTQTATETPLTTWTPTGTPTGTVAATYTVTRTPTETPTPTLGGTPPGESAAGRAAVIASGLSGISSIVGAIGTAITAEEPVLDGAVFAAPGGQASDVDGCPEGGTTSQACTGGFSFPLILGGIDCAAQGPAGGFAVFNGTVTLNGSGICSDSNPPIFIPFDQLVSFTVDVVVELQNDSSETQMTITANLSGSFRVSISLTCAVAALTDGTMNGTLTAALPDGTSTTVTFDGTSFAISDIEYSDDCVPLIYTLTFNGPASFATAVPSAGSSASAPLSESSFPAVFDDFAIMQDATSDPVIVEMSGSVNSDCFGQLALQTLAPVAVAAGELCPRSGELQVTAGEMTSTVTYTPDGGVSIDEGSQTFATCLDPALVTCPEGS